MTNPHDTKGEPLYTPGPWKVEGPRFGYFTVRQDPKNWDGRGYQAICGLPSLTKRSAWRPTFEANAHLIAAAPALYEALKGCVSMLRAIADQTGMGFECLGPADQALAQAIPDTKGE